MGSTSGFRRALIRRPLARTRAAPKQTHTGILPANLPWEVYVACSDGETINVATYIALQTTLDLEGLYDLLELHQVHASWVRAAYLNAEASAAGGHS